MSQETNNENSLYTWCINNGEYGRKVLHEWTGKDINGEDIDINTVTYGSGKKVKMICSKCNSVYTPTIHHLTNMKSGCPYCCMRSTSYPEQFLYRALKQLYPKTVSRKKLDGYEMDITIPEERICIEYGATFWHADKAERDSQKIEVCNKHNFRLIQIFANDDKNCEELLRENIITYNAVINKDKHNKQLISILDYILKPLGHSTKEIDFESVINDTCIFFNDNNYCITSISETHPLLAEEYSTKNNISISKISKGSKEKVLWHCRNCNYEWTNTTVHRIFRISGCPNCWYNWHKAETGQQQKLKKNYTNYYKNSLDDTPTINSNKRYLMKWI